MYIPNRYGKILESARDIPVAIVEAAGWFEELSPAAGSAR